MERGYKMNDLIKVLEDNFSLHDSDEIYNLLSEFSVVDTEITFKQWIRSKMDKGQKMEVYVIIDDYTDNTDLKIYTDSKEALLDLG